MEENMEVPELESTNTFSVDVVVQGFVLKEPNGRKSYVKGKTIRWNINSDDFRMDVLMDGLSSELRVGRDQCITVWYFNIIMAQDVRLTQNDEFHVMFDMYRAKKKLALTVIVLDNPCSETPAHMIDTVDNAHEPTIPDNDVLLVGFQGRALSPSKSAASHATSPLKQFAQVVPSAGVIESVPFDIVEEYVGVDDEYMYDVHVDASTTCVEEGGDIEEEDVFGHHEEEEVSDVDPAGYAVVHDPENPDIRLGALFPDIVACRKAIRQRAIRGWLEPGRKIVKCKKCGEPGHMEKTCKAPDPKYVAVNNDDDIPEAILDPSTPTKKRKEGDETATTTDGDAADDEVIINLIRKKARTTPQKPDTQEKAKKKTPMKKATPHEKAKKKTPVKKATSHEKAKKKTPVKKATSQEKAKKKTPVKKTTSKEKKSVPFAPVMPPPPPTVEQPTHGAKRGLLYWLGG